MFGIFLDRDGVINRERADYVKDWNEFEFLPGVLEALRDLATVDVPILVITNQSCIGRGLVTAETVAEIHRQMISEIARAGGRINGVFVCPHHPNAGCDCRKPRTALLRQAALRFNLQLEHCYFIGDTRSDFEAARAAGCRPMLVQTGLQGAILPTVMGIQSRSIIVPELADAVKTILESGSRIKRAVCQEFCKNSEPSIDSDALT